MRCVCLFLFLFSFPSPLFFKKKALDSLAGVQKRGAPRTQQEREKGGDVCVRVCE